MVDRHLHRLHAPTGAKYVTNCYEGTDGVWRAFLRDGKNNSPHSHSGTGKSMALALRDALPRDPFGDLLG